MATLFNGGHHLHDSAGVAKAGLYIPALTTLATGVNRFGAYTEIASAGANSKLLWSSSWVPTGGGMTVSLCYQKADATNRASMAWAIDASTQGAAYYCHATIPYSDGIVYFAFGGNTPGTTRLDASGLTFGADHWVFSTGPRGMEIWQNSVKVASNGANPTRSQLLTHSFNLGAANFVAADLGRYNMFAMWKRQLETIEIRALNANPYAPWQAPSAAGLAMLAGAVGFGVGGGAGGAGPLVGDHRLAHAGGTLVGWRQLAWGA
jgi:hypothetical protein